MILILLGVAGAMGILSGLVAWGVLSASIEPSPPPFWKRRRRAEEGDAPAPEADPIAQNGHEVPPGSEKVR